MSNDSTPTSTQPSDTDTSVSRRIEGLSPAKRALLEQQLRARSAAKGATNIPRREGTGAAPASFGQELLWHLERSTPGMYAYNVARAIRLRGTLDTVALQKALDALVARHDALRTTFTADGGDVRQVVDASAPVTIETVDLRSIPAQDRARAVEHAIGERARRSFDIATEHQFRVTRIVVAEDESILLWVSHHVALDGWSATVMLRELAALYDAARTGKDAALPALPITFGDFAEWQRKWLSGERLDGLIGYWRERLAGAPELLSLPTDFPRPSVQSFEGGQVSFVVPSTTVAQLKRVAQENDATLYMMILSAYITLLHRYSGQDDIVIGSPVAGRTRAETEGVVGYFANTLVHRNDLSGDPTFVELLGRVRKNALDAIEHQEVPLEKLVMELRSDRQTGHTPLFQCVLTMEDAPLAPIQLDGVSVESIELDSSYAGAAKFDLLLLAMEQPQGLRLLFQYRSDLFEPQSAERMIGHLRTLIDGIVADPKRPLSVLPLLTAAEREERTTWNATTVAFDETRSVHTRFEAGAARTPDATALVCGDTRLTYAQLNARANRLARYLQRQGVGQGTRVGVSLERSAEMIVAVLAVLKTGGAYVPLPPDVPVARITRQMNDADVSIVVSSTAIAATHFADGRVEVVTVDGDAFANESPDNLAVATSPDHVAYVLFTSGSTGVPKGVAVTHGNVANYTSAITRRLGIGDAPLSFATVSTLAADLGNTAVFPALVSGGTLHVIPSDVALDGLRFADYVVANPIDVLKITPSHIRALMSACGERGADVLPAQWLVVGGEALGWDLAERVLAASRCRLLNHYGPTETTVGACTFEVTRASMAEARAHGAQTAPIGVPLSNMRAEVLDAHGQAVPVAVAGELYLSGAQVAQGYVGQPALTQERFVTITTVDGTQARAYRTGDRVRYLANGAIEFLGRTDDQIKVRGYRVELGDIEHALSQHPGVAQSVTLVGAPGADGETQLVAFVVARTTGYAAAHAERPSPERLAAWLADRVPDFMIPGTITLVETIPLNANGKVDRAALRALTATVATSSDVAETHLAPSSETETALAAIWAEVLKKERVSVADNFFTLGGHSLLAIRVLGKLSRQFGVRLPLRTLFDAPTVQQLATVVDDAVAANTAAQPQA